MVRPTIRRSLAALLLPLLLVLSACSSGSAAPGNAQSKDFPKKSITWVVPYAAGGNTDAISRVVAEAMSKDLGQKVVVENKPGGSGAVGMQAIHAAKNDGYTVGLFTSGTMVVTPVVNKLDYNADSFTNIGLLLTQPVVLMTKPDSQYGSFTDLVAAAKAKPGGIKVGVPGATTPQAYELQRMEREYQVKFTPVPFDSNAEVTKALLGGSVDTIALNASKDVQTQVTSNQLKPLAVGEPERLPWTPDTPTLAESGFPKLVNSGTLIGLTAPKDLPEGVRTRLEQSVEQSLKDPAVIDLLGKDNIGATFVGSQAVTEKLNETGDVYKGLITQ